LAIVSAALGILAAMLGSGLIVSRQKTEQDGRLSDDDLGRHPRPPQAGKDLLCSRRLTRRTGNHPDRRRSCLVNNTIYRSCELSSWPKSRPAR
jgi:hypothetical protein